METVKGSNPYATPGSDVSTLSLQEHAPVKILSTRGRLGRVRYIAYTMALIMITWLGGSVLMAILGGVAAAINKSALTFMMPLMLILIYGTMLIGSFMLAIQRVHDFDTNGWITLLFLVPLVNVIFGFVLWFVPGTDGENRYGKKTPPNGTGVKIVAALAPLSFIILVGIIAAIAIPSYQQYKIKAQEAAHSRK